MDPIASVIKGVAAPLFTLVDELFTSDDERNAAKIKLMQMEQNGQLKTMQTQMSAILAEANSADKWTSRARPGFLYVIYIYILAAIPMGFLMAYNPEIAQAVTHGVGEWLKVIPSEFVTLFGVVMLGYTGARTVEKVKGVAK